MSMRKKLSLVLLLILTLCGVLSPRGARGAAGAAQLTDEIAVWVATDKALYEVGELTHIAITAQNITNHRVTLSWPDTCQSRYKINGGWHAVACLAILTSLTIDVGQSYTWTYSHTETLGPGFYVV